MKGHGAAKKAKGSAAKTKAGPKVKPASKNRKKGAKRG